MTRGRAITILAAASLLFLIAIFVVAQVRDLKRPPNVDEAEYLHGAARMALGDRIFVDFVEHHPPLFFGMLSLLAPEKRGFEEAVAFVVRARIFTGVCAAIALAAAAMLVHRISGRIYAPVIFLALLLSAAPIWRNGIGDVRPESAALALWWSGAALVALARRGWVRGIGIGLVFVAGVIAPKWPLESVVIGVVLLMRGAGWKPTLHAVGVAAAGVGATALVADLRTTCFYVFTLTKAMWPGSANAAFTFYGCPQLLRPAVIAVPLLVVLFARWKRREAFAEPRLVDVVLALAAASLIEIRFVYFPETDYRYWVMWSVLASMLLALFAQAAASLVRTRIAQVVPVAVTILALVAALEHLPERWTGDEAYWRWTKWMEERLGPNDTVWVASRWHPIGAPDAHPYWFGADNVIPAAIRLGKVKEHELPPCVVPPALKFVGDPGALPVAHACFERLVADGRVVRTPIPEVWMVRR